MRSLFRGRLGLMLVMLLFLTMVVGGAGWWYTRSLAAELTDLYEDNLQSSIHLSSAERALWELRFALPNYFLGDVQSRTTIAAAASKHAQQINDDMEAYARSA